MIVSWSSEIIKTGGQIDDLKTAMERAKILMMLKEKPEGAAAIQTAEVTVLKDQISALTEQVAPLTAKLTRPSRNSVC